MSDDTTTYDELEQAKNDYKHAKRAVGNDYGGVTADSVWKNQLERTRENLIDAYEGRIEELQSYHDSVGNITVPEIERRHEVEDLIGDYEDEIEELEDV